MDVVFKEIINVKFAHDYFSDKYLRDFSISPTAECRKSLIKYGMLFKQNKTGFFLLAQTGGMDSKTPLKNLKYAGKFSFLLSVNNPYLTNFTDLALDAGHKQIYHYSNLVNNQQNSELLLTHNSVNEYVSDKDLIYLKLKRFLYSESNFNPSALVRITDIKGQQVSVKTEEIKDGTLFYDVDLINYPDGRYKLYVDGADKIDFYADDAVFALRPLAVIDIFINDSLPGSYAVLDSNGDLAPKTYTVKFKKRKTFWKYFVILKNRKTIDPADLTIEYPDSTNSFNKGSVITLSDENEAVPFISQNEIDFSEEILKGIQLKKTHGNGSGWMDIDNLPNASIRNVKPDLPNNKVYSEIYVYI